MIFCDDISRLFPGFIVRTISYDWDIHFCSIASHDAACRSLITLCTISDTWLNDGRSTQTREHPRPCGICASLLQFLCWSADGWGSSAALHVTRNLFLSSSLHFRTAGEAHLTMMRPALCHSPGIKASWKRDSILRCLQRLGCSRVQWTQRRFKLL